MKVLGNNGCNNYNGIIEKLYDTALVNGTLASTRKMCPDMAIPNDYNQALARARSYKLNELNLTMLDESGTELISFKKGDLNR